MKAQGKVKCLTLIPKDPVNTVATGARIVCVDEAGVQFEFSAFCLNMHLRPYCETQKLDYDSWRLELSQLNVCPRINFDHVDLDADYRAGLNPQQCYDKHKVHK